jgi:hypothetical protein
MIYLFYTFVNTFVSVKKDEAGDDECKRNKRMHAKL